MASLSRTLDPHQVILRRDAFNRLQLEYAGERFEGVRARRAFPLTHPTRCIVFRDAEGNDIGTLDDLHALPRAPRALLEAELAESYFATRVLAITNVTSSHGFTTWRFRTDRGDCTAYVCDRGDIRWLSAARLVFTDVNGMKFEITNADALDERSLAFLDAET